MDVAIDGVQAYWTDWMRGEVRSVVLPDGEPTLVAQGQSFAFRSTLALDATHVYWMAQDADPTLTKSAVMRAPRQGGPAQTLARWRPVIGTIALGGEHVFFTEAMGDNVGRVPKAGGNVDVIPTGPGRPMGLAITGPWLLWTMLDTGTLVRATLEGQHATVIASGLEQAVAVVADTTHAYVALKRESGAIVRVPLAGGPTEVLATDQLHPSHLALSGDTVWWTTAGAVWGRNKQKPPAGTVYGDPSQPLTSMPQAQPHAPMGIAVSEDALCWADIGERGGLGHLLRRRG
jgi:sugar lactone lactonase YvrE